MHRYFALLVGLICSHVLPGAEPMRDGTTIRIRDYLNRDWQNETVHYDLAFEKGAFPQGTLSLLNSQGQSVPTQLEPVTLFEDGSLDSATLWFQASVGPFTTETWTLKAGTVPLTPSPALVKESDDEIMLTNRHVGIAIRKRLETGEGPIARIRLTSGEWIGGSSLDLPSAPSEYKAEVISRGPVFAEVRSFLKWRNSSLWEMRLRLQANEPVVLVKEEGVIGRKSKTSFSLNLSDNFAPRSLLFRTGKGRIGRNKTWTIAEGEVYTLEPWLRWWERERQGNCFSLYNYVDLLSIAAGHAGDWVDPKLKRGTQQRPRFAVTHTAGTTRMTAPLTTGKRRWMICCLPKKPVLGELADGKHQFYSLLPYRYLIKHGHLPLDLVKGYVYEWPNEEVQYPHVLFTQEDVRLFQEAIADKKAHLDAIPKIVRVKQVLVHDRVEKAIAAYFATGDPKLGRYITDSLLRTLQGCVQYYTHQPNVPFGCAPHHHQSLTTAMLLADAVLWGNHCTAEQRQRILAQAAFLGYTITRSDYWSPERGYAANPNMTTSVYGYITSIGCLLNTHSGSITIWGKGRIIADDFGYQGYMPGDDHSMLVSPIAPDSAIMNVDTFSTSPDLDYVAADKSTWRRQIAFVKDTDLQGPAYFVIHDTLAVPAPATWRLWLTGADLQVRDSQALLVGNDDVDTDIFLGGTAAIPTTEERTRQCYGMDPKPRYKRLSVTQKGLKVTWRKARTITTLVYPRLKTDAPPTVQFSEDGRQLTVIHDRGTDVVFLSREPFTCERDDQSFHGTVGLVKKRGKNTSLHLGAPGKLTAAGKTVSQAPEKLRETDSGVLVRESFDGEKQSVFKSSSMLSVVDCNSIPESNEPDRPGRCLRIDVKTGKTHLSGIPQIPIDVRKRYRFGFDCFIPRNGWFQYGGYGWRTQGQHAKRDSGRVWELSVRSKGPHAQWQHIEKVLGPGDFVQDLLLIRTGAFIGGPGVIYVDNLRIEEIRENR